MIVLFLDIDGVLNSRDWYLRRTSSGERIIDELDPEAVARFSRVLQETQARVVVSSTWRKIYSLEAITKAMVLRGMPFELPHRFIGKTPVVRGFRGNEIKAWLDENPVERYAIVDDDSDMLKEQLGFFVKTTHAIGLQDEHVERLIKLLA